MHAACDCSWISGTPRRAIISSWATTWIEANRALRPSSCFFRTRWANAVDRALQNHSWRMTLRLLPLIMFVTLWHLMTLVYICDLPQGQVPRELLPPAWKPWVRFHHSNLRSLGLAITALHSMNLQVLAGNEFIWYSTGSRDVACFKWMECTNPLSSVLLRFASIWRGV